MDKLVRKYLLTFKKHPCKFIVTYYNGSFRRVEYKSGNLPSKVYQKLMIAIPYIEKDIKSTINELAGEINYQEIKEQDKASIYKRFMDRYFSFYDSISGGLTPKITGAEGKALKEIINHFNKMSATEDEAYSVWCIMLNKWDNLEDFYKKQTSLKQINSNLNTLLIQIKNGKSSNNKTSSPSFDDLGESLRKRYSANKSASE